MNNPKFKLVKQWITKAGLEAYIVLVRNSHHCGYVEVPDSIQHLDLEMEDIQVHGGVTFQGEAPLILDKHLVGFDCAHVGDALRNPDGTINDLFGGVWRDEEYCIQECESLAVQLISLMSITSAAKAKPDDTDSNVTPASQITKFEELLYLFEEAVRDYETSMTNSGQAEVAKPAECLQAMDTARTNLLAFFKSSL